MGADYKAAHKKTIPFNGGVVGLAANSTYYFVMSANSNWNRCQQVVSTAMTLRALYGNCDAAPGVGETYTYTLMVNNIATPLTCQIAGAVATQASDLVNQVAVVPGDLLSIRLVTSLNAVVAYHSASLEGN